MTSDFSKIKRNLEVMPEYVRRELLKYNIMSLYKSRPAYQQNDYLSWIRRAKRKETQQKRLGQMIAELVQGDVYMGMKWNPKTI